MNLNEVNKLIAQLEQDLSKVEGGSSDLKGLRAELEALKRAVASSEPPHHGPVRDALASLESSIDSTARTARADAIKAAPYVTWIGRILGLS